MLNIAEQARNVASLFTDHHKKTTSHDTTFWFKDLTTPLNPLKYMDK